MTEYGRFDELRTMLPARVSRLDVKVVPLQLATNWELCGLTADYLANFLSFGFDDPDGAVAVLSMVLNEVIENAAKYSTHSPDGVVELALFHFVDRVAVEASNVSTADQAKRLGAGITRLIDGDPSELFLEQVERGGVDGTTAGLGLITLAKDYGAHLAARVGSETASGCPVCVQVILDAAELT